MRFRLMLVCLAVCLNLCGQTISYFNQGFLRQPDAASDRRYLGITNGTGGGGTTNYYYYTNSFYYTNNAYYTNNSYYTNSAYYTNSYYTTNEIFYTNTFQTNVFYTNSYFYTNNIYTTNFVYVTNEYSVTNFEYFTNYVYYTNYYTNSISLSGISTTQWFNDLLFGFTTNTFSNGLLVATGVIGTNVNPSTLGGMKYWWVSSDVATNQNTTNWPDRIVSSSWVSMDSTTTSPTNTASGMYFDGSKNQVMHHTPNITAYATNNSQFLIMKRTGSGNWQTLLSKDYSGALVWEWEPLLSSGYAISSSGLSVGIARDPGGLDQLFDMLIVSDSTPNTIVCYTNGVIASTYNAQTVQADWGNMGYIPGQPFTGYIREFGVFTNALSSLSAMKLHWYATNTYKYLP